MVAAHLSSMLGTCCWKTCSSSLRSAAWTSGCRRPPSWPRRGVRSGRSRRCCSRSSHYGDETMSTMATAAVSAEYDRAIRALNDLQTNHALLAKVIKDRQKNIHLNLPRTEANLRAAGIRVPEDLDRLKAVHVSGTKGKGSTCAMVESILRQRGLKTGLYTSPHLLSVTERIRIDGRPIAKDKFVRYFWQVYDRVVGAASVGNEDNDDDEERRPPYFKFLTVLAFHIFLEERVEAAIFEVGIGGRYDCTNVIRNPVVCGITTLDLDHTSLLGGTIAEIAWHKAGIMKPGVATFTDASQPEAAMKVLRDEADLVGSRLQAAPRLESYDWGQFPREALGMHDGEVNRNNASLALQLARHFIEKATGQAPPKNGSEAAGGGSLVPLAPPFGLDMTEALGLRVCSWPGRHQVVEIRQELSYYFDGAHTPKSMEACVRWFRQQEEAPADEDVDNVLIFNATGDRNVEPLLRPLASSGSSLVPFDLVIFTTNLAGPARTTGTPSGDQSGGAPTATVDDNTNFTRCDSDQLKQCRKNHEVWHSLIDPPGGSDLGAVVVVGSIREAVQAAEAGAPEMVGKGQTKPFQEAASRRRRRILVTGSLHLVGGVMKELGITEESPQLQLGGLQDGSGAGQEIVRQYQQLRDGVS